MSTTETTTTTTGPLRVALIGCGKSKAAEACPASEMYTGALFRAALDHALRTADRVFILSARHGLLELDQVIEPYNFKLSELNKREQESWGNATGEALDLRLQGILFEVTIYAGRDYADAVAAPLMLKKYSYNRREVPVSQPLRGLQVGQRLAWFKARRGDVKIPRAELPEFWQRLDAAIASPAPSLGRPRPTWRASWATQETPRPYRPRAKTAQLEMFA